MQHSSAGLDGGKNVDLAVEAKATAMSDRGWGRKESCLSLSSERRREETVESGLANGEGEGWRAT